MQGSVLHHTTDQSGELVEGRDRLIVALDVPTVDEAIRLVDVLDNVSFFKVGWQLFMAGVTAGNLDRLIAKLNELRRGIFIDLKVPADIANTLTEAMKQLAGSQVKFLTLNEHMPLETIRAARAARGDKPNPKLLMVPYLSSLDGAQDLETIYGRKPEDFDTFLLARAKAALDAGCEGLIASGQAIALFREHFPTTTLVSPAIRPAGASHDDHKRFTTPTQAIKLGSDYLVVGRPVVKAENPRLAAGRIIEEMEEAFSDSEGDIAHGSPSYAHPS
jgi:orotidine-5'-phosphate decarboxylase